MNLATNQEEKFVIVGPVETEFYDNALAITSELSKGLLGKKKGDKVQIAVPSGEKKYKILSINFIP